MRELPRLATPDAPQARPTRAAWLAASAEDSEFDILAAERHAATFKAISDATRLAIVACLARVGEVCVADLTESFELSQPNMSHHLRVLRDAGLLDVDYRGTMSLYRVSPEALERLQSALVEACLEI